jgi:hypothetical protein
MTISATWTWREAGSSKVEATTSPLHRARHLGDFLGTLVDEQHDQGDVGIVGGDGVGDVLHHHRLAALRAGHQQAALALADRRDHVDDARGDVLLGADFALQLEHLGRMQRRQVLEEDLVLRVLRRLVVDLVHLDQREVALAVLRRADLALDGVARVQVEAADLRGRDVDVVGAGQVGGIGRTQEAEAIGQHFQGAVAEDALALLGAVLEQGEDQFLLAQAVGAFDFVGDRHFEQLADVESLKLR